MAESPLSEEQRAALVKLGLATEQIAQFLAGAPVAYMLAVGSKPAVAIIQKMEGRLRSGIVHINDPGNGVFAFASFSTSTMTAAKVFGLDEVELFGAEVINQRLAEILRSNGFVAAIDICPDELGDEEMEILTKIVRVE